MRLKDALFSLQPGKKGQRIIREMTSKWSEKEQDAENEVPLPEYPRPQMRRDSWVNLNGWWDYAIVPAGSAYTGAQGRILVPFSPETARSGVKRILQPEEAIWYVKQTGPVKVPDKHRVLLHFGAADERCIVWWNGQKVGSHRNGYLPFSFDITEYVRQEDNELRVYVRDDTDKGTACRGKQTLKPGGMFYQAQSGIWQTVWLEYVPERYVRELSFSPDLKQCAVKIQLRMNAPAPVEIESEGMTYRFAEDQFSCVRRIDSGKKDHQGEYVLAVTVPVVDLHLWSPEAPYLYPVKIRAGTDQIESYFAMRSFGKGVDKNGHPCITLNGKPYFLNGVLDQGYWPESLMTPPSEAAMIFDISEMKRLGFNMIRKHEKTEPARWYYHCDRIGMVVWQDMVHGGGPINAMLLTYLPTVFPVIGKCLKDRHYRLFSRTDAPARKRFEQDLIRMLRQYGNSPCIGIWGLFNEGWGQFDALRLTEVIRKHDPSRLVDHAGGWYDQGGGDLRSVHNYFRKLNVERDSRPFVLSEYGGYSCKIEGHAACEDTYGYHTCRPEDFPCEFRRIMEEISSLRERGLAAAVYTQLSDIEEETNGLYTYDRKICKPDPDHGIGLR